MEGPRDGAGLQRVQERDVSRALDEAWRSMHYDPDLSTEAKMRRVVVFLHNALENLHVPSENMKDIIVEFLVSRMQQIREANAFADAALNDML